MTAALEYTPDKMPMITLITAREMGNCTKEVDNSRLTLPCKGQALGVFVLALRLIRISKPSSCGEAILREL